MKSLALSAAAFAIAAVVANAGAAPSADSPQAAGKALFAANGCMQCHGTLGQGNRSAGVKLAPHPIPYAAFVAQLRKPRGEMPPYSAHLVSDSDAASIYAYLSSVRDGKSAGAIALLASVGNGNAGAMPGAVAKGDDGLGAGRTVFAQNCASCHGAAGTGGGIGPALVGERAKKNLAATVAFIKHPNAPMPALYPAPLTDRDVANVAAYVQSL